jgi:SAM-dependent methyltransferase
MRLLIQAARQFRLPELAVRTERCALCGFALQVRLRRDEIAVRCLRCGASAITQSLVDVLLQACPDLSVRDAYELSAQGPLVRWLRTRVRSLTTSEYFDGVPPGNAHNETVCQDVQGLTWASAHFDLCTSTEVFEHVEDDMAGFREILRVLRPGGLFVFSVPLNGGERTIERTTVENGQRIHVLPAEYHGDRYRGQHVFCYRNYGRDIVSRLIAAGFADVEFRQPRQTLFGYARSIIMARKLVRA